MTANHQSAARREATPRAETDESKRRHEDPADRNDREDSDKDVTKGKMITVTVMAQKNVRAAGR